MLDRCNSRAASTGGNSPNVIGLACSWSFREFGPETSYQRNQADYPAFPRLESRVAELVKRSRSDDKIFSNVKTKRL
jgi:hypothetical protein